uniref:Nucleotid_trans domain-containing protein n=1 Tax=Meloidogyne hapla TaxID=6305 RepID=A0A1I8BGE8_MELHA
MGEISEEPELKAEIDSVCGMEWRKFDWSNLPDDVRSSQFFAWKVFIMAQIFSEFDTFIWCDTSITFHDTNALNPLFDLIENGTVSPVILPSGM